MSKIDFPPQSYIEADLGINVGGKVHKYFTERCKDNMIPFIPEGDTHLLRQNGKVQGADEIVYDLPYAHYMYMGELYVDPDTGSSWARAGVTKVNTGKPLQYHTIGTGAFWDMRMWNSKGDDIVKEVQAYMDRI